MARALDKSVVSITGEITQQYILRYRPDLMDDPRQKRDIEVTVNVPGVIVNARNHYYPYAVPPASLGSP
ncbi:MAG: hypothetical protein ACRD5L_04915 [Bryobacteraceae bacterium]